MGQSINNISIHSPAGSTINSNILSVFSDMPETGLSQEMEGATGGLGHVGHQSHNQPPLLPPNMGTPVWSRAIIEFPDVKGEAEAVIADALEALTGEDLDRENLIESKWAMETTAFANLSNVTATGIFSFDFASNSDTLDLTNELTVVFGICILLGELVRKGKLALRTVGVLSSWASEKPSKSASTWCPSADICKTSRKVFK